MGTSRSMSLYKFGKYTFLGTGKVYDLVCCGARWQMLWTKRQRMLHNFHALLAGNLRVNCKLDCDKTQFAASFIAIHTINTSLQSKQFTACCIAIETNKRAINCFRCCIAMKLAVNCCCLFLLQSHVQMLWTQSQRIWHHFHAFLPGHHTVNLREFRCLLVFSYKSIGVYINGHHIKQY